MRGVYKTLWVTLVLLSLQGCSSFSKLNSYDKVLTAMAVGASLAYLASSDTQNMVLSSTAGAGLGGSLMAIHVLSDESQNGRQNPFTTSNLKTKDKRLLDKGVGRLKTLEDMGEKDRVNWKLYQLDRWVKDAPGVFVHQDKMIEVEILESSLEK